MRADLHFRKKRKKHRWGINESPHLPPKSLQRGKSYQAIKFLLYNTNQSTNFAKLQFFCKNKKFICLFGTRTVQQQQDCQYSEDLVKYFTDLQNLQLRVCHFTHCHLSNSPQYLLLAGTTASLHSAYLAAAIDYRGHELCGHTYGVMVPGSGFILTRKDFGEGGSTNHFPTCPFFFFQSGDSLHTQIPLSSQGSVESG